MEKPLIEETEGGSQKYEPLYNKVCLIDADIIVHRSAAIAEPQRYLVVDSYENTSTLTQFEDAKSAKDQAGERGIIWSRKDDKGLDFALMVARNTVDSILEHSQPCEARLYLTGRHNFRYKVATTVPYKGSREIVAKPKYYREVRKLLCDEYGAITTDGYEADDAIGMASSSLGRSGFVCTIDKDMDQLAGWHYDWVKDRVYRVSSKEADFNLYAQILSGDSTDDVPGLPGIGPVKSRKILDGAVDSADLLGRVWDQYRTTGDGPEAQRWDYFIEQFRLIYILRHEDDLFSVDMSYDAVFGDKKQCENSDQAESSDQEQSKIQQETSPQEGSNGSLNKISSVMQAQLEEENASSAEVQ